MSWIGWLKAMDTDFVAPLQQAVSGIAQALSKGLIAAGALASAALFAPAFAAIRPAESVIATWPQQSQHVLVGKIWLTRDRKLVDGVRLSRGILVGSPITEALGLKNQAYVLLGEVHDNAEHHLLRAGLIDSLTQPSAFGRNVFPAVVTEHINATQAPALTAFQEAATLSEGNPPQASNLLKSLNLDKSGWPAASMFEPLYEAILEARLPLRAGDVSRDRIRAVARGGAAALEPGEAVKLSLDRALEVPLTEALAAEIKASHCGMLPDSAIPGMAFAQRYRDGHLANAMIENRRMSGRTILLAGNGHVRSDRGVPWYIHVREPKAEIFTLLLLEVQDGVTDPEAYLPRSPDGKPAADAVIFTPRAEREDPCARMRQQIQKKE